MASDTFELGGRGRARRSGPRRIRPGSSVPMWPGMIEPRSGQPLRKQARRRPPRGPRRPWLVGGATVVASLAAVAVVLVYAAAGSGPKQSATVGDPVLGGGPGCEPTRSEQMVRGNGTGSRDSGPDVVLAFQYAYYVTRSGADARAVTTSDASVSSEAVIDAGIASVPSGTGHCVLILPLPDGRFDVVITESRAGEPARTYRQVVSVTEAGDGFRITKIARPDL